MTTQTLTGKSVLFIIASNNFRDEELFEPKTILEQLGAKTVIASSKTGTSRGMLGKTAEATVTIDAIKVGDYDAVVFVGAPHVRGVSNLLKADGYRISRIEVKG